MKTRGNPADTPSARASSAGQQMPSRSRTGSILLLLGSVWFVSCLAIAPEPLICSLTTPALMLVVGLMHLLYAMRPPIEPTPFDTPLIRVPLDEPPILVSLTPEVAAEPPVIRLPIDPLPPSKPCFTGLRLIAHRR